MPEDAARLVALQHALFAETDFLLYGAGEHFSTAEEASSQIVRGWKNAY